jgi:menaquinone-dependent protoporphyrinogen IX oxidase
MVVERRWTVKKVGIYFASKHGQTKKIARFLAAQLRDRNANVALVNLRDSAARRAAPGGFDAVLVGAPVYQGGYFRTVRRFTKMHRCELMSVPKSGFFSVSLSATPQTREAFLESIGPVRGFLDDVSWTPGWIASFAGALNYLEYNPLIRGVMRRISSDHGGPTDIRRDYELTRWLEVAQFAADFDSGTENSRYRADDIGLATRSLNRLMPEFEQRLVQRIEVEATPQEVRSAIEDLRLADMPLAETLARIRNLGRKAPAQQVHFREAANAFGVAAIDTGERNEIAGGLIGQFWTREFNIQRVKDAEEYREFSDPAFTKTMTNFWFDESRNGRTVVRTETRAHSLGPAAHRFFWYWKLAGTGIRWYMKSVLRRIRRSAERQRSRNRTVAA